MLLIIFMFYKQIHRQAFSLVELLITITVLGILASISFVSLQGYVINSRDALRVTDLKNISNALSTFEITHEEYPLPSNNFKIDLQGNTLNYQGVIDSTVLQKINVTNWWQDPVDKTFYAYSTNTQKSKYQLLGFLENQENLATIIPHSYASYKNRFPKSFGDELGFVLEKNTHSPIQYDINLSSPSKEYTLLFDQDDYVTTQTWSLFEKKLSYRTHERADCSAILKNWKSRWDGIYTIYPNSGNWVQVYCDMTNWWYTGLISINPSGTTWKYNSNEWTNPTIKENNFLTEETTLKSYSLLNTLEIKLCRGNLNQCYTFKHNKNIPLEKFYTDDISYLDFSAFSPKEHLSPTHSHNRNPPDDYGINNKDLYLSSLNIPYTFNSTSYNKYGLWINLNSFNKIGLQADNDNSWPSYNNIWFWVWMFASRIAASIKCNSYPVPNSEALSTLVSVGPCSYEHPDTEFWYILGR